MKSINVSIAVISYGQQYLLGFRNSTQHQGNRYEFIGGKIDGDETPEQALIREVAEEIGVDISLNDYDLMGMIKHDYVLKDEGDSRNSDTKQTIKRVCLHVYHIKLSDQQYDSLSGLTKGKENQPIEWVDKSALVMNKYLLPDANAEILTWL